MKKLIIVFIFLLILSPLQANAAMADGLSGKILLQVEEHGEAWYIYPENKQRYYLGRPEDAYNIMRSLGLGISNEDIKKIPLGILSGYGVDSDGDNLSDGLEDAIGTNKMSADSDNDSHTDDIEILNNYNPLGADKIPLDTNLAKRLHGKILLQVQQHGEAWYINPTDSKRYYLGRAQNAFQIMREFGLGITNNDLGQIQKAPTDFSVPATPATPTAPTVPSQPGEPKLSIACEIHKGTYEDTPRADILLGNWRYVMTRYVISADNEAFSIKSLQVRLADIKSARSVKDVGVAYVNREGKWTSATGVLTNGLLTFNQLDIPVSANKTIEMSLNALITPFSEGAVSGDILKLCLDNGNSDCSGTGKLVNFSAISETTGINITDIVVDHSSGVVSQTNRKTRLSATAGNPSALDNPNQKSFIASFMFTNQNDALSPRTFDHTDDASILNQITIQISGSFIGTGVGDDQVQVNVYDYGTVAQKYRTLKLIGTGSITGVDNGSSDQSVINITQEEIISGFRNIIIEVDHNDTDFVNTTKEDTLTTILDNWQWNDGTIEGANATPVRGFPVIPENPLIF
jgi:hypothetical protein